MNHRPETISPLFFIRLPPSNLRPFGAPPSRGRREYPREPLPLEGAAERSEAGLASFFGGARVLLYNGTLETIFFALFHPARTLSGSLRSPPSPRGEGFVRRYSFSTYACIRFDDARKPAFSFRNLPHWERKAAQRWIGCSRIVTFPIEEGFAGERYSRFFIHPTQKRPSLTSGRFYVYYLLRKTLIKSQNSISHVFSCNASSYSSLNSSLFASKYSLHCMKI